MAFYPSVTASFTARFDGEVIFASHLNEVREEIAAMQTEIGTTIEGAFSTGTDYLNSLENQLKFVSLTSLSTISSGDRLLVYINASSTTKEIDIDSIDLTASYRANDNVGNMQIPKFSNIGLDSDPSSSWTIANTTSGFNITIDRDGVYSFSVSNYQQVLAGTLSAVGIVLNYATTGTEIFNIPNANRLAWSNALNSGITASWAGRLSSGDIISIIANTGTAATSSTIYMTSMARLR